MRLLGHGKPKRSLYGWLLNVMHLSATGVAENSRIHSFERGVNLLLCMCSVFHVASLVMTRASPCLSPQICPLLRGCCSTDTGFWLPLPRVSNSEQHFPNPSFPLPHSGGLSFFHLCMTPLYPVSPRRGW